MVPKVLELWTSHDRLEGTAWVAVPGLKRSLRFEWINSEMSICKHPRWSALSFDAQETLAHEIWSAIANDRRYVAAGK